MMSQRVGPGWVPEMQIQFIYFCCCLFTFLGGGRRHPSLSRILATDAGSLKLPNIPAVLFPPDEIAG